MSDKGYCEKKLNALFDFDFLNLFSFWLIYSWNGEIVILLIKKHLVEVLCGLDSD